MTTENLPINVDSEHSKDTSDKLSSDLTRQETRQILTPFAFKIDSLLFGTALAKPWKRGAAILVDLFLIAMLAEMPGEVLALVIAITAFRLGSKKRAQQMGKTKGRKRRAIMRFIGAFIIFIVLLSTLPSWLNSGEEFINADQIKTKGQEISNEDAIEFAAMAIELSTKIKSSKCSDKTCWHSLLSPSIDKANKLSLERETVSDGLDEILQLTNLPSNEQSELKQELVSQFDQLASDKSTVNKAKSETGENTDIVIGSGIEVPEKKSDKNIYSIIEFIKGVITDLGLEFGWAAFYFTAFTALWSGQTPGKKLFKIKVLQLDGTPLSISDSFGRYGGYGAGIATGLLGFMQIFWDANRQAIHDKISATVVIDLTIAKQKFEQ